VAREVVQRIVCDVCRSADDVQVRRVGDEDRLLKFDLCPEHRADIDDLMKLKTHVRRRRMQPTTLEEIEAEKAARKAQGAR